MARSALQRATFLVGLCGCSTASSPQLDGSVVPPKDMANPPGDMPADMAPPVDMMFPGDELQVYAHTVVLDGFDDFSANEQFTTTSNSFTARVAWDAQNLYIGYAGPDLDPAAPDTKTKWMFAYIDVDPGGATGSLESQKYNTQKATFPAGFGAEFYVRWKCDATFVTLEQYAGGVTWTTTAVTPTSGHAGQFIELAVPRSALGATPPSQLGLVTWMINEKAGVEGTFAGLFTGNFTNGYGPALALTKYLRVDFTSVHPPDDPANVAP